MPSCKGSFSVVMANEHFHQADDENAQLEHFGSAAAGILQHFCGSTQRPSRHHLSARPSHRFCQVIIAALYVPFKSIPASAHSAASR